MSTTYRLLRTLTGPLFACYLISNTLASDNIPGQAVIRLDQHTPTARAFSGAGVTILDSVPDLRLYLVGYSPRTPFVRKQAALARRPGIQAVHPNHAVKIIQPHQADLVFPDDDAPVFVSGEQPSSYYGQPTMLSIGLDSAQTIAAGEGVTIAVIDNGVDRTHPLFDSLSNQLLFDLVDNDNDPSETIGDLYGHGTFTAGLIRLAAPDADLMIIRAFDSNGVSTIFDIAQAIDWAVLNGADVINMSFGTTAQNGLLSLACSRAIDAGVTLVASVGNAGATQPVYPAAYPGVIAISAIDSLDLIAPFSNGNSTDVCAPGVSLYSALPQPYLWGTWSGTSFSAALASATAGLVLSINPGMLPLVMETHLRTTATTSLSWGTVVPPDPFYGYGRINAYAAVLAFQPMPAAKSAPAFTVADLRLIVRIIIGATPFDPSTAGKADINRDGAVNQADLDLANRLLFGTREDPDTITTRRDR